jgi:hypothetical protein
MLDLIIKQNNGGISVGTNHPTRGFVTILTFANWRTMKLFIDTITKYYEENCPNVPEAFIQAFKEEER